MLGGVSISAQAVAALPWELGGAAPVGLDLCCWVSRGAVSLSHVHLTANALSSKRAPQLELASMV